MDHDNVERWTGARMWVYRTSRGAFPAALIVRRSVRGLQRDTLVCRAMVEAPLGSSVSTSPTHAILAGMVAMYGADAVFYLLRDIVREAPPGPPGGLQGVPPVTP